MDVDSEQYGIKAAKNKISFDFLTGKDYTKQPENNHIYINTSEGVVDMFSAFGEASANKQVQQKTCKMIKCAFKPKPRNKKWSNSAEDFRTLGNFWCRKKKLKKCRRLQKR